jgi:hypothetical protein
MKKFAIAMLALVSTAIWVGPAVADKACTPTNIQYCKKGSTWSGKKFTTYTVRCSDGTKRTISAWDDRKKWCQGETEKNCSKSQLDAAKKACLS